MNNVTDILNYLSEKRYTNIVPIGSGVYGDVYGATSPQNEDIAVKIIPNKNSWKKEEIVWPTLQHQNILPVINIINVEDLQCKIFVTPRHPSTLYEVAANSEFKKDKNSLRLFKKWYTEILTALDYLHTRKYCHLDLKEDNVLISTDNSAILCDFSGLNVTGKALNRLVAPLDYHPPESFNYSIKKKVEGSRFDIWSYGLLVLNGLPNYDAMDKMVTMKGGFFKKKANLKELKSCLKKALDEVQFNNAFDKAFRDIWISEDDKINALDFVRSLLNFNPKQRPTAAQALRHPFLTEVSEDNDRNLGDLDDSEDTSEETSLSGNEEIFEDAAEENCTVAEYDVFAKFSGQNTPEAGAGRENQKSNVEVESKVLEKNEIVTEVKEQDAPSNVGKEILLIDHMASSSHFDSKENLSKPKDSTENERKVFRNKFTMKGTKKWFEKKLHQAFGKKEQQYERFVDDSE